MFKRHILAGLAALLATHASLAADEEQRDGFLCCNMRTDGSWIADINYAEPGKTLLPVGTPVKITGFGRQRIKVLINGEKQVIGNDYSRELKLPEFSKRYVLSEDPKLKLAEYPEKVRKTILAAKVAIGMSREQVLMSVGYPVTSENPDLGAPVWRFWLNSFAEFAVQFGEDGKVKDIVTDAQTRNWVVAD